MFFGKNRMLHRSQRELGRSKRTYPKSSQKRKMLARFKPKWTTPFPAKCHKTHFAHNEKGNQDVGPSIVPDYN